jgi:hypothetical protein
MVHKYTKFFFVPNADETIQFEFKMLKISGKEIKNV